MIYYWDHLTKFSKLRPLEAKKAAYALLDIFLAVGAPDILQSLCGIGVWNLTSCAEPVEPEEYVVSLVNG